MPNSWAGSASRPLHLLPLGVLVQALAAEAGLGVGPFPERRLLEEGEAHLHGRLAEVLAGLGEPYRFPFQSRGIQVVGGLV